ncbi:uncharacterized protein LOC119113795 [Pollicipes pollicipes]|uniref:uncharacterized protein LOC119113795 n=1 Tax=Pollicipes pollicipes TaxID=41117 RepID=UPI001884B53D|nr:uncharacterized protein LOC119113795 [Pollicipes pollicipes]
MRYFIKGAIQKTLSEGLETIGEVPFLLDEKTGVVTLNFDPQRGMKGYFDFVVHVRDRSEEGDEARVFIYLLRQDQRVKFVLRMQPQEARRRIDHLRDILEVDRALSLLDQNVETLRSAIQGV